MKNPTNNMAELDFNVITPYTISSCLKPVIEVKQAKLKLNLKKRKPKIIIVKPTLPKGLLPMKELDLALAMLKHKQKVITNIDPNILSLAKWFVSNKNKSRINFVISIERAYSKITKTQVKQLIEHKRNITMTLRDNKVKTKKKKTTLIT